MKKTDANRVKSQTLDLIYSQERPGCRNPTLPRDHHLCAGCTNRRAGLEEQKLAAATVLQDMRLGATAGPLDGHAFTMVVDARAGEGGGSSTATLHHSTMVVFPLCFLWF
jgi:hypothetical protein